MTIFKKLKKPKKYFLAQKQKKEKKGGKKLNTPNSKFRLLFQNLVDFTPHFTRNMEENICKATKILLKKMLHYKNYI